MALGYTFSVSGDCYSSGNTGSIQIFPSGGIPPYDFVWCCGLGTNTGVMSSVKTGLSGGTYTINISDSAIIPETITAGVYVSSGVCVSTINSTDTTCGGDDGTLTVSAATPYTPVSYYLYDSSNNFVVSGDSSTGSKTFFGLSAGTYNVDVFDSGGCSGNTGTCIIKSSTDIDYGFYVIGNSNCAAGNTGTIYVTGLTGNPPFTYVWSTGAITTSISGLTDDTYTLTITDATGCSKTKSATISTVPTLGIVNFVNVSPTCFQNDGSVTVNISGGTPPYYYQFSNGLNIISYLQSYTISGLFANSYSVIVTDAGLCTTNGITSISVPNSFNAVSISVVNSTCSSINGSININVSSTNALVYTYTLIDPLGNSTIYSTNSISHSFNGLSGGTYTVTVENPSGCFYSQEVHLFTDNKFTVSSSTTGTTCGGSNGSVTLTASTSGIYTYELSGGYPPIINTSLTSVTFNNLASGIYTATTTDNTGCVQYTTFVINSSSNVGFALISTFCGTGNEGTITALITSGNPPFTFNWSSNVGAQTGIYVTGLTAGTYSLTVTDDDGCQQTLTEDIVCGTKYVSYELYNVCEGYFVETPSSKLGLLQMLNEGFNYLTASGVNCILNRAEFTLNLNIGSTAYTNSFYYTTSLLDVPSDDLYVTTLTNLLNQVPNLGAIDINLSNNTIDINTDCEKILEGVEVKIDLIILYDICCDLQPTPTPTPTPTLTPTPTPTRNPVPTPTPTPTRTLTPTPTRTLTPTPTPTRTLTPTPTPTPTPTKPLEGRVPLYIYLDRDVAVQPQIGNGVVLTGFTPFITSVYQYTNVPALTLLTTVMIDSNTTVNFDCALNPAYLNSVILRVLVKDGPAPGGTTIFDQSTPASIGVLNQISGNFNMLTSPKYMYISYDRKLG
jgi:uncharacterized protein (DUF2141 family)